MLVGLSGKIKSRKDTFASIILKHDPYFEVKKFAFKLKQIVALLIGCTVEQLEDQDFKSKPLGEEWRRWFESWNENKVSKLYASKEEVIDSKIGFRANSEVLTPRLILQILGTECGRELIHPNIWVNSLFADFTLSSNWVITDCRFENEAKAIKNRGGYLIRIHRPGLILQNHPSETSLDNYKEWDLVIDNSGTIENLEKIYLDWHERKS